MTCLSPPCRNTDIRSNKPQTELQQIATVLFYPLQHHPVPFSLLHTNCRTNFTCTKCILHTFINSPSCFGTPHVPSSGSLRSCYHTLSRYDNNYQVHVKLVLQTKLIIIRCTVKGKAVPLQVWSGPEGSRKLTFSDVMTTRSTARPLLKQTTTKLLRHGPS